MYIIHKKYFQYRQYNADTKTSQTSHGQPLQHQYACSPDLPFGSFIVDMALHSSSSACTPISKSWCCLFSKGRLHVFTGISQRRIRVTEPLHQRSHSFIAREYPSTKFSMREKKTSVLYSYSKSTPLSNWPSH